MKHAWIALIVLILAALACNQPGSQSAPPPAVQAPVASPEAGGGAAEVSPQGEVESPTEVVVEPPTPTPTEIPSQPVGLAAGLASLDSYVISINTRIQAGSAQDTMETQVETQTDNVQDAQMTHNVSYTSSEGESAPERSESFNYRVGLESCEVSDGEAEFTTASPLENELTGIISRLTDMFIVTENVQFVGEETINGIPANHFSFTLDGLGSKSGADVTANQGDYWMALDGGYLVKYDLVVELRSSPEEVFRQEYHVEMKSANQAVTIAFPAECLAAKQAAP